MVYRSKRVETAKLHLMRLHAHVLKVHRSSLMQAHVDDRAELVIDSPWHGKPEGNYCITVGFQSKYFLMHENR